MFARHELTYESSHQNADRISKIYPGWSFGVVDRAPFSFGPEGEALTAMLPEAEEHSISRSVTGIARVGDKLFMEDNILVSDSLLFSIFTIPFLSDAPAVDPASLVLYQTTARRYYGSDDPYGEIITIELYGEKTDFRITGVFDDLPSNTHLKADIINSCYTSGLCSGAVNFGILPGLLNIFLQFA